MRPRRCTRGLAVLAVLLAAWAYIFDDLHVLLAAALLTSGIVLLYLRFDHRFRELASSVSVTRTADRLQVRKGATVQVSAGIRAEIPPGLDAAIRETPTPLAAVQDGTTSLAPGPGPVREVLVYRLTPLVHGDFPFPGLILSAKDPFFEREMPLSSPRFCGPVLVVQPTGLFEAGTRRITAETREIEKMSVLSGFGIRALREYYAGDDMRKIDWKQTAKHDKLYVREYTGVLTLPPLIVIDLPWSGEPYSAEDFSRMVSSVAGLAEYAIRTSQYVSVLITSGPNIISFIAEEKDVERCMSSLRRWMHPAERVAHLYRMPDRADLRARIRALDLLLPPETPDTPGARYVTALRSRLQAGLQEQHPLTFTRQVVRTIGQLAIDELYLFSLATGDTSHLRQIARQARAMKVLVHLRVPDPVRMARQGPEGGRLGADTVEAFA